MSSFSLLQQDLKDGRTDRMAYYAFDLLHLDGDDLRQLPLDERKAQLHGCCSDATARAVRALSVNRIDESGPGAAQARLPARP